MDRSRLTKLLAMTTSDNDGEALNAMRMANSMLKSEGKTWDEVLARVETRQINITLRREPPARYAGAQSSDGLAGESWVAPHLKDKNIIEMMFRAVFSQPRSDNEQFWQFMDSIHNRWNTHGNLSQGQYEALRKCYLRAMKHA